MPVSRVPRRVAGFLALAALGALSGCAGTPAAVPQATVTVSIAPSAHAAEYEVQLHRSGGDFSASHRMRTGETRSYTVPAGWLTVRIPGLCVVPTPNTGETHVHVDSRTCELD